MKNRKQNRLPKGWTLEDVEKVRKHYENQTEDEAVAEDEAAFNSKNVTIMSIPRSLVPQVRKLIATHASKRKAKPRKTRRVA